MQITISNDNCTVTRLLIQRINNFFATRYPGHEYAITSLTGAEGSLEHIGDKFSNIYIINMDMKDSESLGVRIAANLRKLYPQSHIIFMAEDADFSLSSFNKNLIFPSGFLIGQQGIEELDDILDEIIRYEMLERKLITVTHDYKTYFISTDDIFYLEKINRKTKIITSQRVLDTNQSLFSLMEELGNQFIMVDRGIVVNIYKVSYIDYSHNMIIMQNGDHLNLARNRKHTLRQRLDTQRIL